MKNMILFLLGSFCCALPLFAQDPPPALIKDGEVLITLSGGNTETRGPGALIQAGEVVSLAGKRASLELSSGNMELFKGARLSWASAANLTQVKQEAGAAWYRVKPSAQRSFEVHTPTAVAGVRGTAFAVRMEPEVTRVCVCEGLVAVSQPGKNGERLVPAGEGADISGKDLSINSRRPLFERPRKLRRTGTCNSCHGDESYR